MSYESDEYYTKRTTSLSMQCCLSARANAGVWTRARTNRDLANGVCNQHVIKGYGLVPRGPVAENLDRREAREDLNHIAL